MIVGTGVDVVEIERIERVLAERGRRFERRVFTPREIESCCRAARPGPRFAIRFAVKEAAMKAVGTGWARGVRWHDIETVEESAGLDRVPSYRLRVELRGKAGEIASQLAGEAQYRVHVAASRSRARVLAVVMLEAFGS